jgi:broad specificity phosphatase PhoE
VRVHFVRHGRPAASWGGGDEDPGLDETGRRQAAAVAETLLMLSGPDRPTRVVSSPLRRCRETAGPLAKALGVPVEIDPAVGEIPTPEGIDPAERPAWLRDAFKGTWADIGGDIDYEAWRARVMSAAIRHAGAAVFSHFVAINAVVSAVTGQDEVVSFRPDHASVTTLDVEDGMASLVSLGGEAATRVL